MNKYCGVHIGAEYKHQLTKKIITVFYVEYVDRTLQKVWFTKGTWVSLKHFKENYK